MKKEIEELIKRPGTKTVLYELSEERKEQLMKISDEVIGILHQRCSSPMEAAIVVQFLQDSLEEVLGGKIGGFIIEEDDQS